MLRTAVLMGAGFAVGVWLFIGIIKLQEWRRRRA